MKDKVLNIFVSPLDWGLGHATRMVPVIHALKARGHNVIIGGGRVSMAVLKPEFPELEWVPMPSYAIKYPSKGNLLWAIIKQMPGFFANIRKEKRKIATLQKKYHFDVIISDNRYGLYNPNAFSIMVTHQLMLKLPPSLKFLENWVYKRHRRMLGKYDRCWVPDYMQRPFLSGDLSHLHPISSNTSFIGPLSRFSGSDCTATETDYIYDIIAILSGPEPARTEFENKVVKQLAESGLKCLLIRGVPVPANPLSFPKNIEVHNHLPACELLAKIQQSKYIVSRAGYSTIMDLAALKRTAILVPTPGQTEQEYLSSYYSEKKLFLCFKEADLKISEAISQITLYQWNLNFPQVNLLEKELNYLETTVGNK